MNLKSFKLASIAAAAAIMVGLYSCNDDLDKNSTEPVSKESSASASANTGSGANPCQAIPASNLPVKVIFASATAAGQDTTYLSSLTLDADTIYLLKGNVRIGGGATLTIEEGTLIKGDLATTGTLVIQRGGKIIANGTESNPIVFTSAAPVGSRLAGDWGGIAICGKAPNNQGTAVTLEGFSATSAPLYGGTVTNDNSGSLRFVRIEYAGKELTPNNEKNGLTLASVGCGTRIDHIQVSFGKDDAFEWFGGNVNARYLIAYKTIDDDFDSDFGYSGNVQFGISHRVPTISDISLSNGFESDNQGSAPYTNTPQTSAIFSNFTILGPARPNGAAYNTQFQAGAHLRRGTGVQIRNSVIVGWPTGVKIDNVPPTSVTIANTTVLAATNYSQVVGALPATANNIALSTVSSNFGVSGTPGGIYKSSAWNLSCPDITIPANSPLKNYGTNADPNASNFTFTSNPTCNWFGYNPVDFRGAKGEFDNGWKYKKGWISWTPESNVY